MISKAILPFILIITIFCLISFNAALEKDKNLSSSETILLEEDFFANPDLVESYKSDVIYQVFKKLKMAKGDFRTAKPALHFVKQIPNNGRIAVAYPAVGLVFFEEKMYDVCVSVGADSLNALAAVLSHELTHCYEKHTWEDNFKRDFKKTQMDSVLRDHYMDDEIQADYLGGFLAYAAGFQPFGIMEKLYEKEYAAYGLTDEALEGSYPPMKERVQIATNSHKKLDTLIQYFEMGNLLVALKAYNDAFEYYNAVEGVFQSREIYNNLGVVAFLTALDMFQPTEMGYAFPIELDAESRLGPGHKGASEDRAQKLKEAMEYFEKAKTMDAFYPIAWLNLGCAQALYGLTQEDFPDLEFDEAEISAKRAIRLAKGEDTEKWKKTITDAYILLGLIEALRQDAQLKPMIKEIQKLRIDDNTENIDQKVEALKSASTDAVRFLEKALKMDPKAQLAQINKNLLEGATSPGINNKGNSTPSQSEETIGGKRIVELGMSRQDILSSLYLRQGMIFASKKYPESKSALMVNSVNNGTDRYTFNFYITDADYEKTTERGIKIGDDVDKVISKYPNPPVPIGLGQGYFLTYRSPKLIFQFDVDHVLRRWVIYNR